MFGQQVAGGDDAVHHRIRVFACAQPFFHQLAHAAPLRVARKPVDEIEPVEEIRKSLEIAGDLCIYTNRNFTIESLD